MPTCKPRALYYAILNIFQRIRVKLDYKIIAIYKQQARQTLKRLISVENSTQYHVNLKLTELRGLQRF
jgi:hypothetical protein